MLDSVSRVPEESLRGTPDRTVEAVRAPRAHAWLRAGGTDGPKSLLTAEVAQIYFLRSVRWEGDP
jgi:hypothetical protein